MKMTLILILIAFCGVVKAPSVKDIPILQREAINPYETICTAIGLTESNLNANAIGDLNLELWSYGTYQIRQTRLDDYFRQTGIRYSVIDMLDPQKAKKVFMFYACEFDPWEPEKISRAWNGGPDWMTKKSTVKYWRIVKSKL